jgi:hypothetical protein
MLVQISPLWHASAVLVLLDEVEQLRADVRWFRQYALDLAEVASATPDRHREAILEHDAARHREPGDGGTGTPVQNTSAPGDLAPLRLVAPGDEVEPCG